MSDDGIFSSEFRGFVRANIASVEQVDVLLRLYENPDRAWEIAELSKELASSDVSISRRLAILCKRGLVIRAADNRYRYHSNAPIDDLVKELRTHYAVRPTKVIDLIYSQRTSALELFSDAFLLSSEDLDG